MSFLLVCIRTLHRYSWFPSRWNGCNGTWLEMDQVAFACIRTPRRPLYIITECHRHDMNDYAKLYAQFPSGSTIWQNDVAICEMEGNERCRISAAETASSTAGALPFNKSHEAEIFTLNESALKSISLCPAVIEKHFGFVLTSCGTTNMGSLAWNEILLVFFSHGGWVKVGWGHSQASQQLATRWTHKINHCWCCVIGSVQEVWIYSYTQTLEWF